MILLFPILLLVGSAAAILFIRAVRPTFPALWLIAVLGSITAWLMMLFLRIRLPASFTYLNWSSDLMFAASPGLLLDYSSWQYAFAITTLVLAVVLVSPGHLRDRSEMVNIAGSLALGGLGLQAVLAANPVSLLMGWAAMDIIELFILLRSSGDEIADRNVLQVFATRIAGIMIAMWTFIVGSKAAGFNTSFSDLSPQAGIPLLIAIGLRVGVFPLHLPFTGESSLRRGQGTLLRMVPAASGFVVLSRIPSSAISERTAFWLGAFALLALIYSSLRWMFNRNDLAARPFWLVAMTAFGILAVLQRKPEASLAWGATLVFLGSAVFLLEYANRFMRVLLGIGLLSMLGLPFTANAAGVAGLLGSNAWYWTALSLISFFVVVVGLAEKIMRKPDLPPKMEQIIYLTYPVGIMLLVGGYLFVGLFGWHGSRTIGAWGLALVTSAFVIAWMVWDRRTGKPGQVIDRIRNTKAGGNLGGDVGTFRRIINLEWFYGGFRYVFNGLGRVIGVVTFILEGSAGIFWAVLILVLFLALIGIGGA